MENINDLILQIEKILKNQNNKLPYIIGGYITGNVYMRDNIEKYYRPYPELEEIGELGVELETLDKPSDQKYAEQILNKIKDRFSELTSRIDNTTNSDK